MNAAAAMLAILRREGVRYLFGNPGTTELTFLDALPDSGLDYVLGLQEATAVAAADGYAQASGQVAVVNLHVLPGLANGVAILDNAARARSPLVVTAGQQDSRLLFEEPILAGDMVRLTRQFTKWSYEVRRAEEGPAALRRALKVARTSPTGPVFLSLPMDLMQGEVDDDGAPVSTVGVAARPDEASIARAAEMLAGARSPLIVAGDGVARAEAMPELIALAERLGAGVHGEPLYRRTSFPGTHPLWRGGLFPTVSGVRKSLESADAVLIVGANVFAWFLQTPGVPFPTRVPVIQIDVDAWEIGKSHRVDLGLVADPRAALAALDAGLAARMSAAQREAAAARARRLAEARAEYTARVRRAAEAEAGHAPISPAFLFHTLAGLVPEDVAIVDESASSLPYVLRYLPFAAPGSFFGSKTGTLGWGMGAAIGVQLASPGRKVVATVGDGSVMYAPQALWTAAHRGLPITYVVANNASYAILKSGMISLALPSAKRGLYPGMDIVDPEIDYVGLARSLGVRAERVVTPGALRDTLAACLAHDGPALVDVAIDRGVKGML
jgi:benzoylformate decarboxylase